MRCLNLIDFPYKLAIMSFVCFFPLPGMLCYNSYMNIRSSKRGGGSRGYLENMARKPWSYSLGWAAVILDRVR